MDDKELLIEWRRAYIKHLASKDKKILEQSRLEDEGQPRSVRMLNTIARMENRSDRYVHTATPIVPGSDSIN